MSIKTDERSVINETNVEIRKNIYNIIETMNDERIVRLEIREND